MKYVSQTAELVEIDDPVLKIEWCGRICYNSRDKIKPGSAEKFVAGILKRGHLSVLRHVWLDIAMSCDTSSHKYLNLRHDSMFVGEYPYTLGNAQAWYEYFQTYSHKVDMPIALREMLPTIFGGFDVHDWFATNKATVEVYKDAPTVELLVSEAIATQFVRHSTLAFSVMSDRYVKRNELEIVRSDPHAPIDARYEDAWRVAERSYLDLVSHGVPAQEARRVLPNAVAKRMVVTGDMAAWKHFFKLRCANDADPMARDAALKIKALKLFKDMEL
jgi:thymidylate synthase (FAD)